MATAEIKRTAKKVVVEKLVETVVVEMTKREAAVIAVVLGTLSFNNLRTTYFDGGHAEGVWNAINGALGEDAPYPHGFNMVGQQITKQSKGWIDSFKETK